MTRFLSITLLTIFLSVPFFSNAGNDLKDWYIQQNQAVLAPEIMLTSNLHITQANEFYLQEITNILFFQLSTEFNFIEADKKKELINKLKNNKVKISISDKHTSTNTEQAWPYIDQTIQINPDDLNVASTDKNAYIATKLLATMLKQEKINRIRSYINDNYYSKSTLTEMRDYIESDEKHAIRTAFKGEWETEFGKLTFIEQTKDNYTRAYYGAPEDGKLIKGITRLDEGKVIFEGEWYRKNDPTEKGEAVFILNSDRISFEGKWNYVKEVEKGHKPWTGTKILSDNEKLLGEWQTNYGLLLLMKDNNGNIKGFYDKEEYGKTLEGHFIDQDGVHTFEGMWGRKNAPNEYGWVNFSYNPKTNTFKGKWNSNEDISLWYDWSGSR